MRKLVSSIEELKLKKIEVRRIVLCGASSPNEKSSLGEDMKDATGRTFSYLGGGAFTPATREAIEKIVAQVAVPDTSESITVTSEGGVWGRSRQGALEWLGQLPEPLLPLLPPFPGGFEGEIFNGEAWMYDSSRTSILALKSEALEWRRTRAAALLASCEE